MALGKRLIQTSGAAACNTESVTAFGADAAYSHNVALYQLDGNDNDTTGNYNGSDTNVTYSTGKFGQAAVFNGSSSYIDTNANFTPDLMSFSAWVNPTDSSAFRTVFSNRDGNSNNYKGIDFGITDSGNIYSRFDNGGSRGSSNSNTISLPLNTWTHLAFTINMSSSIQKVYKNGVFVYQETTSGSLVNNNDFYIGRYFAASSAYWQGSIDQVRIFDREITSSEVSTLYAETSSTASNTNPLGDGAGVALYSLDYDASETSGLYDGTPTDVDFGVGGQINTGARFNGSSSFIETSSEATTTEGNKTISGWIFSSVANNGFAFVANGKIILEYTGNAFKVYKWVNGKTYYSGAVSAGEVKTITTSASYSLNTWYHVAIMQTGTGDYDFKLYINGTEPSTTQGSTAFGGYTASNFIIGSGAVYSGTRYNFWNGSIDQVRVFTSALTDGQVSTLAAEQACVHTATTTDVDFPVTNAAYYKLDNSAEDEKGTSSSETDIEYRFGRYGQAAIFDGANSVITNSSVGTALNVSAFTFSLWFKTNVNDSTDRILISSFDGSGNARFYASVVNSGLSVVIYGSSSTYIQNFTSTVGIGNWYHLAVTHTGTTTTVYLNGTAITPSGTSGSAVAIKIASSPQPLTFGQLQGNIGTYPLNGSIDQVRIFTSSLSAANVLKLAEEKPETDTSNFKAVLYEGTGASQYISNVGMDLETSGGLVWIKSRSSSSYWHTLFDTVRGPLKRIFSNSTSAESNTANTLTSFDSNGFTIGNQAGQNANNITYVAWNWKGGGTAVSNGNGSITSSVSANTAAGFSIVTYTGTSTIGDTIGHGLGTPDLIIVKNRDNSSASWAVWSSTFSAASETLFLDLVSPSNQYTNRFGTVNSTTFQAGSSGGTEVNASGNNFVAYIFKSVAAYSKISSYSGTGGSGNVQTVGFRPSLVVIKRTNTGGAGSDHWLAFTSNVLDASGNINMIRWDTNETEFGSERITFQDTSFTLTDADASRNATGGNYLYIAIK